MAYMAFLSDIDNPLVLTVTRVPSVTRISMVAILLLTDRDQILNLAKT